MRANYYKARILPYLKNEFVTLESISKATGLPENVVKTAIRNLQHHNDIPVRVVTKRTYGCILVEK